VKEYRLRELEHGEIYKMLIVYFVFGCYKLWSFMLCLSRIGMEIRIERLDQHTIPLEGSRY
jgi:hypothetical protein